MGKVQNLNAGHFSFEFLPEPEFDAFMPEQFFVRAMHSNSGFFLTEEFVSQARSLDVDEIVDYLMNDLNKENREDPNPVLMLYYLFTDFGSEFPRIMMMRRRRPLGRNESA